MTIEQVLPVNTILQGDSLTKLKELPNDCIDCVITSPPYWALRDYKVDGQLGLEPTFNEYLAKLLAIFDEIKRVLKPSGTVFVNLGDTYAQSRGQMRNPGYNENEENAAEHVKRVAIPNRIKLGGAPTKSLLAIPDRFKIAMIDRGWICRNEIIWYKRNCMPSSAKDRFTVDYEKIFFFTKNERYYFETQYEPYSENPSTLERYKYPRSPSPKLDDDTGNNWTSTTMTYFRKPMPKFGGNKAAGYDNPTYSGDEWEPTFGRLKRCVWDITTQGFSDAHFATFPEELVENCIKPGCPVEGVCLDPFFGSGTVGLVAMKLARNFLGIELNSEYIAMAMKRLDPYLKQERLF